MLNAKPEYDKAFFALTTEVFRDGALDMKTKALIAIAASLTAGCGK
jgi:alkylhydroperoxidase/carboxymuconolactone decarboxylase family protein YurZ